MFQARNQEWRRLAGRHNNRNIASDLYQPHHGLTTYHVLLKKSEEIDFESLLATAEIIY